jgi:hypothetical protein
VALSKEVGKRVVLEAFYKGYQPLVVLPSPARTNNNRTSGCWKGVETQLKKIAGKP